QKPGDSWAGKLRAIAQFVIVSLLFGLAYTQDPIYYSPENQNTKYLQGLARGGYGFLSQDWTANTLDPLPAFTALVQFTYQFIHPEYGFYLFYFLIFGVYVYSMVAIVNQVFPIRSSGAMLLAFLGLMLFFHTVHLEIFEFDLGEHLHYGVAEQYILGPVFQPCNFGVFLLVSIYAFLKQRPYWAVVGLAIAATFHPAYFPSVLVLTLSYMGILAWETRSWKMPLGVGIASFLLILPVFSYMYFTFADTTPELAQQATDIIVNQRIPHHSIPAEWLKNGQPYVQMVVVAIALYLIRQTRLFYVLIFPFVAAVVLTMVQMQVSNDFVAFIAPWRISVFLVPIGTCIVLGWAVTALCQKFPAVTRRRSPFITRLSLVLILTLVMFGSVSQSDKFRKDDDTFAMMDFIRDSKQSGETYLIPADSKILRKFRLYTGAPIYINRKTHPYLDTEVIAWNERLEKADAFYATRGIKSCRMLRQEFLPEGVTHVVLPRETINRRCKQLKRIYKDESYGVFSTERL
ncbi:MAG: DUF6798 domain-containing protein, partial [Elainellaceae cyanobacterium]